MMGEVLTLVLCSAATNSDRAATMAALADVVSVGGHNAMQRALRAAQKLPRDGSLIVDIRDGRCLVLETRQALPERVVYIAPSPCRGDPMAS